MIKKGKYIDLDRRQVRRAFSLLTRRYIEDAAFVRTLDAVSEWQDVQRVALPSRQRAFMRRTLRLRCSFY